MPDYGPCETWTPRWTCDVMTTSPVVTGQAVQAATAVLWSMSGQRFGLCTTTIRPCRRGCIDAYPRGYVEWIGGSPGGILGDALWFAPGCSSCGDACSCTTQSEVVLPAPVDSIVAIKVDGVVLDPSAYVLYDARRLLRVDGEAWPTCNDLSAADTEDGTWSITASYGEPVPALGELAVGELACELLRAFEGDDCSLPANVQSLARQGVTIEMPDPAELRKQGLLGLRLGDLFIQTYNPHKLTQRSRAFRVDGSSPRRETS